MNEMNDLEKNWQNKILPNMFLPFLRDCVIFPMFLNMIQIQIAHQQVINGQVVLKQASRKKNLRIKIFSHQANLLIWLMIKNKPEMVEKGDDFRKFSKIVRFPMSVVA